ncbi:MAG: hypothetical protein R3B40_24990 [Polyangiales bacterium]|nr:hypothetical protein [Myxococcales bacterium]MCB9661912.1 hypothetical protein [Sandaracinaceae bacterium]
MKTQIRVSVAAVTVLLLATPAVAANDGFFPGTFCVPETAGTTNWRMASSIQNISSSPVDVICPLVTRDASAVGIVYVVARDNTRDAGIDCLIHSRYHNGTGSYLPLTVSSDFETGWRVRARSGVVAGFNSGTNPRSNWVSCTLPPATGNSGPTATSAVGAYAFLN